MSPEQKYHVERVQRTTAEPNTWVGGAPGSRLAERFFYKLMRDDYACWTTAVLFDGAGPFEQHGLWTAAGLVLLGARSEFLALSLDDGQLRYRIELGGYFGSFEVVGDELFVAGMGDLLAFDANFQYRWAAHNIAVDGIIISEVTADLIKLNVELDPPGGWQPLVLRRIDGRPAPMTRIPDQTPSN